MFRRLMRNVMESQERNARAEVARLLQSMEYRSESVDHIQHMLETGQIGELR